MEAIQRIRSLIRFLPERDIILANTFTDSRDFEALQELVDSAIIKVRRNLRSDNPKKEYINLDIYNIDVLKAEIDIYVEQLSIPPLYFNDGEEDFYDGEHY